MQEIEEERSRTIKFEDLTKNDLYQKRMKKLKTNQTENLLVRQMSTFSALVKKSPVQKNIFKTQKSCT